jgi:hypothetical protein
MLVYGIHAVGEALKGRKVEKLIAVRGAGDKVGAMLDRARELRVPVEIVDKMALERLTRGGVHQNIAAQMETSVKRGKQITTEILRFTRPAVPVTEEIAVTQWFREIGSGLRDVLAGMTLRLEIPPGMRVAGDRTQLTQVLHNLAMNARENILRFAHATLESPPELIGERKQERDQCLLVMRIHRQDVLADAFSLPRFIEQAIPFRLLERAWNGRRLQWLEREFAIGRHVRLRNSFTSLVSGS